MNILGLDISTSVTGVAIIDENENIIHQDAWKFTSKDFKDIFDKAQTVKNELIKLDSKFDITNIIIEQALFTFKPGKSSAQTLSLLTKFNGIVSYLCWNQFHIKPEFIGARSARKLCGLTIKKGQDSKKIVMQFLIDTCPEFNYRINKNGNIGAECYDIADAIILAKAKCKMGKNVG